MKRFFFFPLILSFSLFFMNCEKDDPEVVNQEEVITTLDYTLVPTGGGTTVTLSFEDLDGDGGAAPTITAGTLAANTTYTGTLTLLNESASPVDNITEEVEGEGVDHQFFFQSTVDGISVSYNDQDDNGNPVGLSTTLTTGAAASGTMTITLRHEPDKTATGVSSGDISNAGGETDIEVTFTVAVQ